MITGFCYYEFKGAHYKKNVVTKHLLHTYCYVKMLTFAWEKHPGTDVVIFKIFSPKNLAKILEFLTQNKAKF
jgi:hypothetical protein